MTRTTRESQYNIMLEKRAENGLQSLGLMTSQAWDDDPKRLTFTLARYKFVAKMMSGRKRVLEIGCGDAFGTRIVVAEVGELTAIDFDPVFVDDVNQRMNPKWSFTCFAHNMLEGAVPGQYDGIYALDVLEHIHPRDEDKFLSNTVRSLAREGEEG